MKKLLFFCLNVEGSGSFTHKSLKNQELFTSKGITPAGEKKTALASHFTYRSYNRHLYCLCLGHWPYYGSYSDRNCQNLTLPQQDNTTEEHDKKAPSLIKHEQMCCLMNGGSILQPKGHKDSTAKVLVQAQNTTRGATSIPQQLAVLAA